MHSYIEFVFRNGRCIKISTLYTFWISAIDQKHGILLHKNNPSVEVAHAHSPISTVHQYCS